MEIYLAVNFNLPDKKYSSEIDFTLFPLEVSQKDIETQIQQAPVSIQKISNYYLLSDYETKYEDIYIFLKYYRENNKIPLEKINDPIIYKIIKTVRRIQRQIHKLMGLLRFREIEGGYLYAPFESDFDIIVPLSKHFAHRFPNERLILHDAKRGKALFIEKGNFYEVIFNDILPSDTENEILFQQLWRRYHQNISINQRENKKLQRQNIPIKFQQWLTEFHKIHESNQLPYEGKKIKSLEE